MSEQPLLKVKVFTGQTLEEAAEKANNMSLLGRAFAALSIVQADDEYKIVVAATQWEE